MDGRPIEQLSKFLHQIITNLCLKSGKNFSKIAQTIFELFNKLILQFQFGPQPVGICQNPMCCGPNWNCETSVSSSTFRVVHLSTLNTLISTIHTYLVRVPFSSSIAVSDTKQFWLPNFLNDSMMHNIFDYLTFWIIVFKNWKSQNGKDLSRNGRFFVKWISEA